MELNELIESVEMNMPLGYSFTMKVEPAIFEYDNELPWVHVQVLKGETILHSEHLKGMRAALEAIDLWIKDLIK